MKISAEIDHGGPEATPVYGVSSGLPKAGVGADLKRLGTRTILFLVLYFAERQWRQPKKQAGIRLSHPHPAHPKCAGSTFSKFLCYYILYG